MMLPGEGDCQLGLTHATEAVKQEGLLCCLTVHNVLISRQKVFFHGLHLILALDEPRYGRQSLETKRHEVLALVYVGFTLEYALLLIKQARPRDLYTLGASQKQSQSGTGHLLYYFRHCLEVAFRRLAEFVHAEVATLERILLGGVGQVKAARALTDREPLYNVSRKSSVWWAEKMIRDQPTWQHAYSPPLLPYYSSNVTRLQLEEACNLRLVRQ